MKFKIQVKHINDGHISWEEYDKNISDADKWAKDTVKSFNETLRPHESPRELLRVEVIDGDNGKFHDWDKDITGMSANFRGRIVDIMYCKSCGITGKRYGLNPTVKIDAKYRKKAYRRCDTAKIEKSKN